MVPDKEYVGAVKDIAKLRDYAERLEAAMQQAIKCIDTNLYHQREKVEDAAAILRSALGS